MNGHDQRTAASPSGVGGGKKSGSHTPPTAPPLLLAFSGNSQRGTDMRGRKPLPRNVHLLRGNPSGLSKQELSGNRGPAVKIPTPPDHLGGEALAEWGRITGELYSLGLVTAIDRAALALYCESWGLYVQASEQLKALGGALVVEHPNGFKGPSPWLGIRDKAAEQCRRLLVEFGMSPSSRSRAQTGQLDLFDEQDKAVSSYFG